MPPVVKEPTIVSQAARMHQTRQVDPTSTHFPIPQCHDDQLVKGPIVIQMVAAVIACSLGDLADDLQQN